MGESERSEAFGIPGIARCPVVMPPNSGASCGARLRSQRVFENAVGSHARRALPAIYINSEARIDSPLLPAPKLMEFPRSPSMTAALREEADLAGQPPSGWRCPAATHDDDYWSMCSHRVTRCA